MSQTPHDGPAPKRGVIAVIEEEGRLLVIRRAEGILAGGSWCFPGGGIEPGETPVQALIREVREEVGIEVEPLREVWEWLRPDRGLHLRWWTARRIDRAAQPILCPAEVAEMRWASPDEIQELDSLLPSNREFLDQIWPFLAPANRS